MTDIDRARHLDAVEADLDDVEQALARLEAGTYETCEVCSGAIGDDVLAVTRPLAAARPGTLTWSGLAPEASGIEMPPRRRRHTYGWHVR